MARKAAVHLNQKIVQSLRYEGTVTTDASGKRIEPRCVKWDAEVKGLGLRVYPTGKKAWVFAYTVDGRKRLMQLGTFPALTLDGARKAAQKHGGQIAKAEAMNEAPIDPIADRERASHGITVADLCAAFLERHVPLKKTAGEYRRKIERHILPAWGTMKAKSIRRADVAKLHHGLGSTSPYSANRLLALIAVLFEKGREWGFLPENHVNPARGVQTYKEHKRDRWVTHEELPRLAAAIDRESGAYVRGALWLYLLTGARKSELLNLQWSAIDTDRREIRLADTKAGRPHYIPLSPEALAILGSIPRLEGNPYVFPGRKEGRPLVNIGKSWRRIRKAAGMDDVRLHDLRRTVGSWLATRGASLPLIGRVLGHSQPTTTSIYARLAEDPARAALDSHGAELMEVAKGLRVVK